MTNTNNILYIDVSKNKIMSGLSGGVSNSTLKLIYGSVPLIKFNLVVDNMVLDVSEATAWQCSVDDDFDVDTEPMTRSLNDSIDSSSASSGVIIVSINTNTAKFLEKTTGKDSIKANLELRGFSSTGDTIYCVRIPVQCLSAIDLQSTDPVEIPDNIASKSYVTALVSPLSSHVSDSSIHVTSSEKEQWNAKQDEITADNKLDYTLISNTPAISDSAISIYQGTALKGSFTLNQTTSSAIYLDSASGGSTQYAAGTNISIADNTISVSGVVDSALKDSAGNIISSTYQKQFNSSNKLNASYISGTIASSLIADASTWNSKMSQPANTGSTGQVLTKTDSGYSWQDSAGGSSIGSSIIEFSDSSRVWTSDDLSSFFRYTGTTTSKYDNGRIYFIKEETTTVETPANIVVSGLTVNTAYNGTYSAAGTCDDNNGGTETYYSDGNGHYITKKYVPESAGLGAVGYFWILTSSLSDWNPFNAFGYSYENLTSWSVNSPMEFDYKITYNEGSSSTTTAYVAKKVLVDGDNVVPSGLYEIKNLGNVSGTVEIALNQVYAMNLSDSTTITIDSTSAVSGKLGYSFIIATGNGNTINADTTIMSEADTFLTTTTYSMFVIVWYGLFGRMYQVDSFDFLT